MVNNIIARLLARLMFSVVLISSLLAGTRAYSYPSAVRHGYTTCTTCHFSPSGGGLLNSYGKFVAGELFGALNDSETALPWITKPTEDAMFVAGGLFRVAQTYFDTPQVKRSALQKMQADLEGGVVVGNFLAMATIGPRLDSAIEGKNEKSDLFVRRFYVGAKDVHYAVRVGKFFPEYGINHYNHNIATRRGLFFNHNEEPYIGQASYYTETFDYNLAYLKGAEDTVLEGKKGYSTTVAYKRGTMRAGLSGLSMKNSETKTGSYGAFGQFGYFEKGYTLVEFDRKTKTNAKGHDTRENLGYLETGWEAYKGFNPYLAFEHSENLTTDSKTQTPELGLQLHPVTHLELIFQVGKSDIKIGGRKQSATHGFVMANVYF